MSKKAKTEERSHAVLSASKANQWLNCPPSVRLEEQFPETTTEYAEEGTLAHSICELKLRKEFIEPMGARAFNNRLKKFQEHELFQNEMLAHTDTYLEYVQSIVHSFNCRPFIAVETKLNLNRWVPEGFGTSDCIVIGGNTLHVIDFKYGKTFVDANENPQIMLYALGAIDLYEILYSFEDVHLHIVQPRLDSFSTFDTTKDALLSWGEEIKPIAQMAFEGKGEFKPDFETEDNHCKFCRVKSTCRARGEGYTALEDFEYKKPPLLTKEEVSEILSKSKNLENWISDIKNWALSECLEGREIPGWKAVEGRSNRQITDVDKAFDVLKSNGYEESLLYERKPITLTKIEQLVPKKQFNDLLGDYIVKPPGKPTLAPLADKRKPITNNISAQEDFNNE